MNIDTTGIQRSHIRNSVIAVIALVMLAAFWPLTSVPTGYRA